MKPTKFLSLFSTVVTLSILLCPTKIFGSDWDMGDYSYYAHDDTKYGNGGHYYYDNGSSSSGGIAGTDLALDKQDSLLNPGTFLNVLGQVSYTRFKRDYSW